MFDRRDRPGIHGLPPPWGFVSATSIIIFSGIFILLFVRLFPRTTIGKKMTLSTDGRQFKANVPSNELIGREGEAVTALRPAGIALINGHRHDVVADSEWIAAGAPIRVTATEGMRIVVRECKTPEATKETPS